MRAVEVLRAHRNIVVRATGYLENLAEDKDVVEIRSAARVRNLEILDRLEGEIDDCS